MIPSTEQPRGKVTSAELMAGLVAMHSDSPIAVANKRDFLNLFTESDFVVATLAGQVYEYEIKVSRADFARDWFKLRNRIYSGQREGRKPNRFWYVTPEGIISEGDLPSFAGWIEYVDGALIERRRAPLIYRECHGVGVLMRLAMAMRNRKAWR